jgi:hypothetical protein
MSKLSKREVEVIVKEVMNGIKVLEQNKSEELFNNSANKESFLDKVSEIEDLSDKMSKLEDELIELRELSRNKKNELENLLKEEGIEATYLGSCNLESKEIGKPFKITLQNAKSGNWGLRCKIEDELILQGINNKIDINIAIKELIEKHK